MFEDVKIVFLDIDNTLTPENRSSVSIANKLAVKNAQKKKIYIVLSSGRSRSDVKRVWNQIHLNEYSRYVIYSNGAIIEDLSKEKKIFENPISDEDHKKLVNFALKRDYLFAFSESSIIWSGHNPTFYEKSLSKIFRKPIKKYDKNFSIDYSKNKFSIFINFRKNTTLKVLDIVKENFPNLESTTATKDRHIEITNKNVNKAEAAKKLLDYLKIEKANTMAIGDSMNDFKLFQLASTSVVVKNGNKNLKKVATYQTKSSKKDGVGKVLENLS